MESLWIALQPIVDLRTGEVIGHEALIRGPSGSAYAVPEQIFQYAREHEQGRRLEEVCRALGLMAGVTLPEGQRLFLNVDMEYADLPIGPADVFGGPIALEVSERRPILGNASALKSIGRWRDAGYSIVLDDYGAGYASLGTLLALQPDMVKIDRFIVSGLDTDHRRIRAIENVVDLAHEINAKVIAEGIESLGELRMLRALGVGYGQGFCCGKPERQPQRGPCSIVVDEGPVPPREDPLPRSLVHGTHDAFYEALLNDEHEGIYFVDKSRTILEWSQTAEQLTGFQARDVLGRKCMSHILDHVSESGVPLCNGLCPLVHAMADGKERQEVVFMRNKDGERKRVLITAIPVRGEEGHVVGAIEKFRLAEAGSEKGEESA